MLDAFWEVLAGARQVMIGVPTRRGPHVTPELFVVHAGRIWCATAASTLKARRLAAGAPVAIAARDEGGAAAVATGRASVLDPLDVLGALKRPVESAVAGLGFARFVQRNAPDMAGAVMDLLAGRMGTLPPRRVVFGIEPDAVAVVEAGGELTSAGTWAVSAPASRPGPTNRTAPRPDTAGAETDRMIERLPSHLAVLTQQTTAMMGWFAEPAARTAQRKRQRRPVVLSVTWDPAANRATLPSDVFRLAGGQPRSPAAVSLDGWTGYGPSGKQGVMLRGQGAATEEGDEVTVEFDVERVVYWDGVQTGGVG